MEIDVEALAAQAKAVSRRAYANYSNFQVGAAVLADDGRAFAGCNVENSSFGLTICAERAAVFRAVAEGAARLVAVAIYTPTDQPVAPCGACRQVLAEFADDMQVVLTCDSGKRDTYLLSELLPNSFRFKDQAGR